MNRISKEYAQFSEREKGKEFTYSAGAALYGRDSSITDIFTAADKRLYKAKAAGRNIIRPAFLSGQCFLTSAFFGNADVLFNCNFKYGS